jgi:hypothetical protein
MKICSVCKIEKLVSDFAKDKRKPQGVGAECKSCKNERSRNYRRAGRDKIYRQRDDVKERKKALNKLHYNNNKQQYFYNHRKWIENNYLKFRKYQTAYTAGYRAYKKLATPKWANKKAIFDFYKNCPEGMEVDHIIPLNHPEICGLHVIENLQYLSRSENAIKNNNWDGTVENDSWRSLLKKS